MYWVQLEVLLAFSIVTANAIFLATRFCIKLKLFGYPNDYEIKVLRSNEKVKNEDIDGILKKMRENTDYLKGNMGVISSFVSLAVPFLVGLF